MHASTLLISLAATASAVELAVPAHKEFQRGLEARQTGAGASACLGSLMSIYSSIPTPTGELASALVTATDPCSVSVPSTLSPAASSYTSQVMSWASANLPAVESALSQCPDLASMASSAASGINALCTNGPTLGGGASSSGVATSGTARPTGSTGGSGGSGGASGNGTSPAPIDPAKAAGSRNSVVAAGMAAAGFVGAVALL